MERVQTVSITIAAPGPAPASLPVGAPPPGANSDLRQSPASGSGFSFHELLSELNPLQYIPVIGTIYRSVTGDTIPEPARIAGSLVVSGLTGGPVGVAINVALLGLEKATGIDPEKIGHDIMAGLGLIPGDAPSTKPVDAPAMLAGNGPGTAPVTAEAAAPKAWTASQLSAYGVKQDAGGDLTRAGVSGSDVLNDLVLAGLGSLAAPAPAFAGA